MALAAGLLAGAVVAQPASQMPEVRIAPEDTRPDEINPFAACRQRSLHREMLLDATRRRLHQTVCGAALWFDGLFGGHGDLDAARDSSGRAEVSTSYSEFDGTATRLRFHARVKLPAIKERLSAFVGIDDEDDIARDRAEGQALRSQARRDAAARDDERDFFAGLGYRLVDRYHIRSDFKIGVRNLRLPKVFMQNRFTFTLFDDDNDLVQLRVTPFLNNRDGFGQTHSLDYDRALDAHLLLRWGSAGTLSEKTAGFDWRSALILYQGLNKGQALAYEAFIRGATRAPETLAEYGVRLIYRRPLIQTRLNLETGLGYSWPRIDPALEREGAAAVSVGLEMPFGEAPEYGVAAPAGLVAQPGR